LFLPILGPLRDGDVLNCSNAQVCSKCFLVPAESEEIMPACGMPYNELG